VALLALKAGADGYITKDSEPEILLAAIRKVAHGGKYIDPALAEEIAYNATFPAQALPHEELSGREFEIFRLLVAGKNINEISQQLILSSKTVSTYKTRIMEKMNIHNVAELVRYAVQHGLAEDQF
jgi:DNA-binding NarL/FixJ family response regulator